jgi:multidrug efflux pump
MSLPEFSVKNPVLVNMIMITVFLFGIYTVLTIPKEEMPAVDFGAFYILVTYRGVSPLEMEQQVTKKIEDQISSIENIDYISSTSQEGRSSIYVRMLPNADIDRAWDDLNTAMSKVTDLPADADTPNIVRLNMREVNSICTVTLGGDLSGNALREMADDLRDDLLDVANISRIEISGTRARQIWVDADTGKLNEYGITLTDLMNAIKTRNVNIPGGTVQFGASEFVMRTIGEFSSLEQIKNLVLRMDKNGNAIRIGDVADVQDTLEETTVLGKLNGQPSVNLFVYKDANGDIIRVMKDVRAKIAEFTAAVPGVAVQVRNDGSINVKKSIDALSTNALLGIVFVFILLFIFIGWRNALFAVWGIPFSFLLAFILMRAFDITINNLSLFALILVSGMIVDDAIIVIENIHRYIEGGMDVREATVKGAKEIMWPVVAAVSTTIVAFIPMLMMKGMMGKFMKIFPVVVTFALSASLVESLFILPSHVAEFTRKTEHARKKNKLYDWILHRYRKTIIFALGHRILVVSIVLVALVLAGMAVSLRAVRFQFFPRHVSKTIVLRLQTPTGSTLEETDAVVSQVENYILNMKEKSDVEAVISTVGQYRQRHRWHTATSNAEIRIDLIDPDNLTHSVEEIKDSIRSFLNTVPELYTYQFAERRGGPPTGGDIELRISGNNLDRLEYIGNYIIGLLKKIPGVADLNTSFEYGKKEFTIVPKYDRLALYGVTVQDIASLVNTASYGTVVSQYSGEGLDEYDIVVKDDEGQTDSIDAIENLRIRTNNDGLITLKDLADFRIQEGFSAIEHWNKKRVLTVTGNTSVYKEKDKMKTRTPDEVTRILRGNTVTGEKGLLSGFSRRFPGYKLEYGGAAEEQRKTYNSLYIALIVALFLVYTILGTEFKSYVQPLIVMVTIPFAFIGVIFGLFVTRLPFSLNTLVAVLALVGVVVNDSLVLVDFVNRERERGIDRWNSLINAGMLRLRPIILTTVTTIGGFTPFLVSTSSASSFWKPMAVSIAFGLAFATVLTLIVIPVIYSLVDSLFGKLNITRFKSHISFEDAVLRPNNTLENKE